ISLFQAAFQPLAITGDRITEYEIDHRNKYIGFYAEPTPRCVGNCHFGGLRQIKNAYDDYQRRILEKSNKDPYKSWNNHLQRLGQDDQPCLLPITEPQGIGTFI